MEVWVSFGMVGVAAGIVAFVMDLLVDKLVLLKWSASQVLMASSMNKALLVFLTLSALFAAVASLLTVYVGPGAVASGTPELMAYLNGINYPKFISVKTLIVKVFGLCLAVSAGLCIGKEGPLAHIGAILGHSVSLQAGGVSDFARNSCGGSECSVWIADRRVTLYLRSEQVKHVLVLRTDVEDLFLLEHQHFCIKHPLMSAEGRRCEHHKRRTD